MRTADIRHNRSGYYDETAYKAIISADKGSRKKEAGKEGGKDGTERKRGRDGRKDSRGD